MSKVNFDILDSVVGGGDNINPAILFASIDPVVENEFLNDATSSYTENDNPGLDTVDASQGRRNGRTQNPRKRQRTQHDDRLYDLITQRWKEEKEACEARDFLERERQRKEDERAERVEQLQEGLAQSIKDMSVAFTGFLSKLP